MGELCAHWQTFTTIGQNTQHNFPHWPQSYLQGDTQYNTTWIQHNYVIYSCHWSRSLIFLDDSSDQANCPVLIGWRRSHGQCPSRICKLQPPNLEQCASFLPYCWEYQFTQGSINFTLQLPFTRRNYAACNFWVGIAGKCSMCKCSRCWFDIGVFISTFTAASWLL